jgi:hypothetical protein
MSPLVKVFGCRPFIDHCCPPRQGRRSKTSKEGNRESEARVKLPLSTDFGNANSPARGSRAPKPVTLPGGAFAAQSKHRALGRFFRRLCTAIIESKIANNGEVCRATVKTQIKRRLRCLNLERSLIEVAFDEGFVVVGDRRQALTEVELAALRILAIYWRGTPSLPAAQAVTTLWRGVAIGFSLRDEGRDYLSGVTAFRTAVPSSFACSSMAASCFFTYSD